MDEGRNMILLFPSLVHLKTDQDKANFKPRYVVVIAGRRRHGQLLPTAYRQLTNNDQTPHVLRSESDGYPGRTAQVEWPE